MPEVHFSRRKSSLPGLRSSRVRILVADRERIVASITSNLLQDLGYDVCTLQPTTTGLLKATQHDRPDRLVADTMLVGSVDGPALVASVSRLEMPNLFITGDDFYEPIVPALAKVFNHGELIKASQCVLDRTCLAELGSSC